MFFWLSSGTVSSFNITLPQLGIDIHTCVTNVKPPEFAGVYTPSVCCHIHLRIANVTAYARVNTVGFRHLRICVTILERPFATKTRKRKASHHFIWRGNCVFLSELNDPRVLPVADGFVRFASVCSCIREFRLDTR